VDGGAVESRIFDVCVCVSPPPYITTTATIIISPPGASSAYIYYTVIIIVVPLSCLPAGLSSKYFDLSLCCPRSVTYRTYLCLYLSLHTAQHAKEEDEKVVQHKCFSRSREIWKGRVAFGRRSRKTKKFLFVFFCLFYFRDYLCWRFTCVFYEMQYLGY
jgi:hypothetical protein